MVVGRQVWEFASLKRRGGGLAGIPATRLFLISFAMLIAFGTLGLLVLPGIYTGGRLGFVDALFTATSAVCVTGLIVVDTATYFTPLGQAWIALLIQLGGLGILTFTTLLIVLLGRRTSLALEEAAGGHASAFAHLDEISLVKAVVASTLALESVGALALWLDWKGQMGSVGAIWPAVFHSISAFSNAGFSIFTDSLTGFQRAPLSLLTIAALVILGGIGFVVLADLRARLLTRTSRRIGTHTQLALIASALLLAAGTYLFFLFESRGQLAQLGWVDRLVNAFFMSVTPRTAGFSTVDYDAITDASLFLTIILMVIGGSPGSTAGGLKTTTFALLGLALWTRLTGKRFVNVWGRTVPDETVRRAAGLAVGAFAILALGVLALSAIELPTARDRTDLVRLVFEVHSAFGTVGLSMGGTSQLSVLGRLIVVGIMFIGRVGPLAVASSMVLAERRRAVKYRFPYEDVVVG